MKLIENESAELGSVAASINRWRQIEETELVPQRRCNADWCSGNQNIRQPLVVRKAAGLRQQVVDWLVGIF